MALNVEETGAYKAGAGQVRSTRPRVENDDEVTGRRPAGVPDDWFVDPIRRGVPGVRRAVEDDDPLAWQTDALCAQTDPEAFFPEKGGSTRDAKRIC